MLNLLYTVTCLAVTTFFSVLVWYLINIGAAGVGVVASNIWFGFIVGFLTMVEREKKGNDSSLFGSPY
ncbi:hypothetical protein M3205_06140 [Cytobacillus firmus]|uniref:hypothetical protein n=1 Tax=Cytobacillus firmus TaxID=1399 RepID=UPI00203CB2CE|nr:hypothetical protein [Cytobacillus firmus]MCM3705307.1 hypothetical protein [Cytobacillus firmus]